MITIRPWQHDDIVAVHQLEQEVFPHDAWSKELFEAEFKNAASKYYVAVKDEKIVGYGGILVGQDFSDIMSLAVLEECRKQGIASELLDELLSHAPARVLLEVRAENAQAQKLYTKYGFTKIDIRKNYYPGGVDAVVMMRD